jgi:hypothetical protein
VSVSLADIYARNLVGDYVYVYNYSFKMNALYSLTPGVVTPSQRGNVGLLMRDKQGSMRTDTCGLLPVKVSESGGVAGSRKPCHKSLSLCLGLNHGPPSYKARVLTTEYCNGTVVLFCLGDAAFNS